MAKSKRGNLPPRVYRDRSRYVYREYLGRENGKAKRGKPIRLCALDAPLSEVWREWERVQGQSSDSLRWLLTAYNSSDKFAALARPTQIGYEGYLSVICDKELVNGNLFGDVALDNINIRTMRKYLDNYEAKTTGNRHAQYISAAWNWAFQRWENVPAQNPCLGLDLNREKPRDRYIDDAEYKIAHKVALSMRTPIFAYAMELAYLCRARRGEVFSFALDDVREEGLLLRRSKGSLSEITLWTPRLRAAVNGCQLINPKAPRFLTGAPLIPSKSGKPYTKNALDSSWQRVINKALDSGLAESFTFHDIKAKGVTDHDMENAGLHKSKKMQAVYERLPKQIPATD
jgi:integrase